MVSSLVRKSCLLMVAILPGCSSQPQVDEGELNLRRIVQAYILKEQQGRPPRKVEDLKKMLPEIGDKRDPDVILVSPRDKQPYVILFGHTLDDEARTTILAYEKIGKDGKRWVAMLSRDIKLMSDADFAEAEFAGGHQPK